MTSYPNDFTFSWISVVRVRFWWTWNLCTSLVHIVFWYSLLSERCTFQMYQALEVQYYLLMWEENHNLCCVFFTNCAKSPLYYSILVTMAPLVVPPPGRLEPGLMRYIFSGKYPGAYRATCWIVWCLCCRYNHGDFSDTDSEEDVCGSSSVSLQSALSQSFSACSPRYQRLCSGFTTRNVEAITHAKQKSV